MTVGVGIKCSDGIVLACDSLTTFGRGVPVLRYTNKVHTIKHDKLESPVAVIAAGMTTYFDKFQERARRHAIEEASKLRKGQKLDVVEFTEDVCEIVMSALLKEYGIDRPAFFGGAVVDYSLSLIVAGITHDRELRGYFVHTGGVSERLERYGTIGSGAAYAELFLRFLLTKVEIDVKRAGEVAIYAIKGVEMMDPNVGGDVNVRILTVKDEKLNIADLPQQCRPEDPAGAMEGVLQNIGKHVQGLVSRKGGASARRKR